MAGEKQQPTFIEEPKIPTDDKTPACPEPNPPDVDRTWPELVGLTADEAAKKIKEEKPGIKILVVPPDFPNKMFDFNRVILYVDCEGKVEHVPRIG
ncbi:hypothetical protein K2173_013900 [Erythroxylum novogranatense]|uniref:Uncharacterized protein n=1 Tax=Erythroxylum novogranatense TaxID=1862640 RepID=A0AAV8SDE3_9ROSI|nr:hypothetical protein K2173_013900 [Erythroxylum novogranatense]